MIQLLYIMFFEVSNRSKECSIMHSHNISDRDVRTLMKLVNPRTFSADKLLRNVLSSEEGSFQYSAAVAHRASAL